MSPRVAFAIPAYQAERSLGEVLGGLAAGSRARGDGPAPRVVVIDDGSTDGTARVARDAGAEVLTHPRNLGKGRALSTALEWARSEGIDALVTLDADGQHPPEEALRLAALAPKLATTHLVLAVRDLAGAEAPLANQRSNAFSNRMLSHFGGERLLDTQCGLRRYPVRATLALGARDDGFAFESELVLRAARRGLPLLQVPARVLYPKGAARVTHFHNARDPARIVLRILLTTFTVPHHRWTRRWLRRGLLAVLGATLLLTAAHLVVRRVSALTPPPIRLPALTRHDAGGVRRAGRSSAVSRQGIWEVRLRGTPEELGLSHALLLRDRMVAGERALTGALNTYVPSRALQALLLDTATFAYRGVEQGMSTARRRELAAAAHGFQPDPFAGLFPTYQRFVYLSALYDISLGFEYSPLIGCSTFTVGPERSLTGGALLARAFDFEVDDIFDQDKAVFFVEEPGQLPYASVAWPGLVGVVSGLNVAGVAVVVHGARAGETRTRGEPLVHALRRVLGRARTTAEVVQLLDEQPALVSHLIIATDAAGKAVAIERVPDERAHVRALAPLAVVTNHLEGPHAADPKNQRVRSTTSTLARRARGDALIAGAPARVGPVDLVAWLRDRRAADGAPLPPGDRRALDALIATHGVVMDATSRTLWVSRAPHLLGEFVRYDLADMFATEAEAPTAFERPTLPADPERAALISRLR